MKLEAGCGVATSEPKKEAEPDAEPLSENLSQEARAKSKSGSGVEAENKPLGANSGPEAKAKFLWVKPRSRSEPEAEAEQLDFMVATEWEFEEVLAISGGIYGGLHYLPSCYHSWLRDPNRTLVLAKRNGGVIALQSVHVIDAGKTALVEGLRVAPWEQQARAASFWSDSTNASALLAGLGTRLAALRDSGIFSPLPTEALSEAGGDGASLLLSPSVQRDVLPGGTIIQDWQPYQPSESNLRLLASKALKWRVDSRTRPRVITLCTRSFPIPHGGDGTWCYLNIDAFGCDCAQVQSQLLWHLQRQAPRLAGLNVMCQLFPAPQLWSQLAYFCQAGLGLELVKDYTEQYLLEADI
uniref:Putative N-acetyltransferase 16 (Putative) n=1 Tax=Molossus molossus TaxID=27622 RepID=A0A7J8J0H5_MOLMO|nr:putative N-acetyltransferase 16 (putative) [Molossus molossus]